MIKIYQLLFSSFMGRSCRFYPTCSSYATEAIKQHGAFKGAILTLWRLLRCGPWNKGGYDPVPSSFQKAFCCDKDHAIQHTQENQEEKNEKVS